jgi:molecular chaperone GrpE (heat shock protein)
MMIRFLHVLATAAIIAGAAAAQDIPGVENCSAEKAMDRRTGCLQANVNYLQTVIAKNAADSQQKLAAANAEIASLKTTVARLQASVDQLAAAAKMAEEAAKKAAETKGK